MSESGGRSTYQSGWGVLSAAQLTSRPDLVLTRTSPRPCSNKFLVVFSQEEKNGTRTGNASSGIQNKTLEVGNESDGAAGGQGKVPRFRLTFRGESQTDCS